MATVLSILNGLLYARLLTTPVGNLEGLLKSRFCLNDDYQNHDFVWTMTIKVWILTVQLQYHVTSLVYHVLITAIETSWLWDCW